MDKKEYDRLRYLKNKNKIKKQVKKYQQLNKSKIQKRQKEYGIKNRNKLTEYQKTIRKKYPWRRNYETAKARCENTNNVSYKRYGLRGITFKLTMEDVKKLWLRDKAYLLKQPSIDREDNNGNYEYSNCRFMELSENSKKK